MSMEDGTLRKLELYLHSGGFGNTYLVKGIVMDENIAQEATYTIKEFYFAKYCTRAADGSVTVADASNASRFNAAKADFYTEANILHGLKHDGIVPVNEVFCLAIEGDGSVAVAWGLDDQLMVAEVYGLAVLEEMTDRREVGVQLHLVEGFCLVLESLHQFLVAL